MARHVHTWTWKWSSLKEISLFREVVPRRDPLSDQTQPDKLNQSFWARRKAVQGWPDHPFPLPSPLSNPLQDGHLPAGRALYKGTWLGQPMRAEILPVSTYQAGFMGPWLCLLRWRGSFSKLYQVPCMGEGQFWPSWYHISVLPQDSLPQKEWRFSWTD